MFFLPGLAASLLVAGYGVKKRLLGKKALTEHGTLPDGTGYHFTENRHKGRLRSAVLGVSTKSTHYFGIKKESLLDKLFKAIGISVEVQTRNKEFDDAYYLMSDNPALCQSLAGNTDFREAMKSLATIGVHQIEASPELVWAKVSASEYEMHRADIIKHLSTISHALKAVPPMSGTQLFNRSALLAIIYNTFHLSWLGLGVYGLFATMVRDTNIIDTLPLLIKSLVIGGVIAGVWLFSILAIAGRTSRGHIIILDFIIFGIAGILLSVWTGLYDYNVSSDSSIPTYYDREIVNKQTYRCGRRNRSTCYSLMLYGFIAEDGVHSSKVNRQTYNAAQIGGKARVTLYQGALGFRWVDKISLVQ